MSEQKLKEFRKRAQLAVATPDPGLLLKRGRALRRRRQLAPVAAVAAFAVIGIGFLTAGGGTTRTDEPPANQPTVTEAPTDTRAIHTLDIVNADGQPDATFKLFGSWSTWSAGASAADGKGVVSWGFQKYEDTIIDQCHQPRHATTRQAAATQVSQVQGTTVTVAPRPATKMGLTGTYLQLSVPIDVTCPHGTASGATLMASWDGSTDPTVTVDVWLLEDGDQLLILTRGVRGNPSRDTLTNLDLTLDTLRYLPAT